MAGVYDISEKELRFLMMFEEKQGDTGIWQYICVGD